MITVNEAYENVLAYVSKYEELAKSITISEFASDGPDVYGFYAYRNDGNPAEDDYLVSKTDGTVRPIFCLGWDIEYPESETWPVIKINHPNQRAS